ncbi:MAG: radical SAM protein [bacterium]|nr:radical SAM protein [bacterium]
MNTVYSHTLALCPECREKVPARIVQVDEKVYMEKYCPGHGVTRVLISSDVQWYEKSMYYVKPGQEPLKRNVDTFHGCPESCGYCPEHQQHTCLPVIEITNECQMDCPICLKEPEEPFQLTLPEFEGIIDNLFATEGKVDVINLSGGEPTLHPQFETFVELALEKGVAQISVSTNGIKLLEDPATREVFKRTQTIAALQFDGFSSEAVTFLRGEDMTAEKKELMTIMEAEGIPYSLVATVAKGINHHEIPQITDHFFQSKALTLMFQPISFTGNATGMDTEKYRLTIPCVVRQLEQSNYITTGDFNPLPCSHYSCFALSYYLQVEEGQFASLKSFLGEDDFLTICANKTLPGLDCEGYDIIQNKLYELWSAADSGSLDEKILARIKTILRSMQQGDLSNRQKIMMGTKHMKAIFIHHFMDLQTMDFGRLVKCCNPYPRVGDRLIPMCAANMPPTAPPRGVGQTLRGPSGGSEPVTP